MNSGQRPIEVTGARFVPRPIVVSRGSRRGKITVENNDDLPDYEPDQDVTFIKKMEELRNARSRPGVTHAFVTGYFMFDDNGKPMWSNHVMCSHQKCAMSETAKSYEQVRAQWAALPPCRIDPQCPLAAGSRARQRNYT